MNVNALAGVVAMAMPDGVDNRFFQRQASAKHFFGGKTLLLHCRHNTGNTGQHVVHRVDGNCMPFGRREHGQSFRLFSGTASFRIMPQACEKPSYLTLPSGKLPKLWNRCASDSVNLRKSPLSRLSFGAWAFVCGSSMPKS